MRAAAETAERNSVISADRFIISILHNGLIQRKTWTGNSIEQTANFDTGVAVGRELREYGSQLKLGATDSCACNVLNYVSHVLRSASILLCTARDFYPNRQSNTFTDTLRVGWNPWPLQRSTNRATVKTRASSRSLGISLWHRLSSS